jgi:hypothetical protein
LATPLAKDHQRTFTILVGYCAMGLIMEEDNVSSGSI